MNNNFHLTYSICFFLGFVVISSFYFFLFVSGKGFTYEPIQGFVFPVNIHDHYVYVQYIEKIRGADSLLELLHFNNNTGIALIYLSVINILALMGAELPIEDIALFINVGVFFLAFLSYKNIIKQLKLPYYYLYLFFINISFVYFAQLINKDSLTILVFLKTVEYSLIGSKKRFYLLCVLSVFVRIQLPVFIFIYWFLLRKNTGYFKRFVFVYIVLALASGYLAKYQLLLMSEETLASGFSYLVFKLNTQYYIGSLLLNPIRALQYFYDLLLSFSFYNNGYFDVSRIKNIPQAFVFIVLLPIVLITFFYYEKNMRTPASHLMAAIVSFFLVWLLNPMVNVRYVLLILPIIILLGFYQLKFNTRKPVL
jgi:hypothetical protein